MTKKTVFVTPASKDALKTLLSRVNVAPKIRPDRCNGFPARMRFAAKEYATAGNNAGYV
jgi:hypothetical protein